MFLARFLESGKRVQENVREPLLEKALASSHKNGKNEMDDETEELKTLEFYFNSLGCTFEYECLEKGDNDLQELWDMGDKWEKSLRRPCWRQDTEFDVGTSFDMKHFIYFLIKLSILNEMELPPKFLSWYESSDSFLYGELNENIQLGFREILRYIDKEKHLCQEMLTSSTLNCKYSDFSVEQEGFQYGMSLLDQWRGSLEKLNKLCNYLTTQDFSVALQTQLNQKEELSRLSFRRYYMQRFLKCTAYIKRIQRSLYTHDLCECMMALRSLLNTLQHECCVGSVWIFEGDSREYLVRKLELLLESVVLKVVLCLQNCLEELDFGGLEFKTRFERLGDSERDQVCQILSYLTLCQSLYDHVNSLKCFKSDDSNPYWLSFCLAGLVLIHFDILFLHSSSHLCNFKYIKEPFYHISCIFLSHLPILQRCLVFHDKKNYVEDVIHQFSGILAHRLQFFAVKRCSTLESLRCEKSMGVSLEELNVFQQSTLEESLKLGYILKTLHVDSCVEQLFLPCSLPQGNLPYFLKKLSCVEKYLSFFNSKVLLATQVVEEKNTLANVNSSFSPPKENCESEEKQSFTCELAGSQPTSLFNLLCSCHQQQLTTFLISLKRIPLVKECCVVLPSQAVECGDNHVGPVPITSTQKILKIYFSERARIFIEGMYVLFKRVELLKFYPKMLEDYTNHVFQPALEEVRYAFRDVWNALDSPVDQLKSSSLILESFQMVLHCLNASLGFVPAVYLSHELSEWKRLLFLAYEIFVKMLLEKMGFPNLKDVLAYDLVDEEHEEQGLVRKEPEWVGVIHDLQHSINLEPGRSELLNRIGKTLMNYTLQLALNSTPLLYPEDQKRFVRHCQTLIRVFQKRPSLQNNLHQLEDLQTLMEAPVSEARSFLFLLEQIKKDKTSTFTSSHKDEPAQRPFLGVRLVLEAEKFLKLSKQQMLHSSFISDLDGKTSECSLLPSDVQRPDCSLASKIQVLTNEQCYIIIKRKTEFAFSTSPGYS